MSRGKHQLEADRVIRDLGSEERVRARGDFALLCLLVLNRLRSEHPGPLRTASKDGDPHQYIASVLGE